MYIRSAATISHQPTFGKQDVFANLPELSRNSQLIEPEYRDYIPAMMRRRMSNAMKMGVTCALKCLEGAQTDVLDGIIVGTGLGLGVNTAKFVESVYHKHERTISPTPFSVSTANSIAGQLSLMLKNHGYNNTHTQSSLSFEQALIDAELGFAEGMRSLVVGGTDELDERLFNYDVRLGVKDVNLGIGASFFHLLSEETADSGIVISAVEAHTAVPDVQGAIDALLERSGHQPSDIGLLLYSDPAQRLPDPAAQFKQAEIVDYNSICGTYLSNSAFALAYAFDVLKYGKNNIKAVLICNQLIPGNLGLMLIRKA